MKINKTRRIIITVLFSVLLLSVSTRIIHAQDQKPDVPDFGFSETETLEIDVSEPTSLFIINKTILNYELEIWITDFGFITPENKPITNIITLQDEKKSVLNLKDNSSENPILVEMAVGEIKQFFISIPEAELKIIKSGTYYAYIIASEPLVSKKIVQRQLKIVIDNQVPPTSLVESIILNAQRASPLASDATCLEPCSVPLKVSPSQTIDWEKFYPFFGFLFDDKGNRVQVDWHKPNVISNEIQELPLTISSISKPGTYKGKIDLLPDDEEKGIIDITLNVTDSWVWPFIALVLGVLITYEINRYTKVRRKLSLLKERNDKVSVHEKGPNRKEDGEKYKDAKAQFKKHIDNAQGIDDKSKNVIREKSDYLRSDLFKRTRNIADGISNLKNYSESGPIEENDEYKALADEISFIEKQLERWGVFGEKWARVYDLIEIKGFPLPTEKPNWTKIINEFPNFIYTAKNNYWENTQTSITLNDFVDLYDKVTKALILISTWGDLHSEILEFKKYIENIYHQIAIIPMNYRKELFAADRIINQAWAELWLAKDADELKEKATTLDIENAKNIILGLYRYYVPPVSEEEGGREEEDKRSILKAEKRIIQLGRSFMNFFTKISDQIFPKNDYVFQAKFEKRIRYFKDGALLVFSSFIAVLTGLNALYFGKNFGLLPDYFAMLTWGAASNAVVESVFSAVNKFITTNKLK